MSYKFLPCVFASKTQENIVTETKIRLLLIMFCHDDRITQLKDTTATIKKTENLWE
ncbi:hypothetical protein Fmac_032592 [Flemingia macrophylla]|uniref:Uncharacterized protein n=1 Tax=Flemingia macrophylla TaxID=520843 RepID=A0ABD1L5C0_9FABA